MHVPQANSQSKEAFIPPSVLYAHRTCAWCLQEQGIVPGEESHGICVSHAEAMIAQQAARRRQRQANRGGAQ